MSEPQTVRVGAAAGEYLVHVGEGLLDEVGSIASRVPGVHRCAVISDLAVAQLYGDRVLRSISTSEIEVDLFTFPVGEAHKTRKSWSLLTDALIESGFGRDSLVVGLGGGVTGDLAGFVAATFMRGIPVLHVPTSVVAMVDSGVGGKTGVDTVAGKNLVGAFHPPVAVVIDPSVVSTLTARQRSEGWVEAVKHGAILDEDYFLSLIVDGSRIVSGDSEAVLKAVLASVEIKAGVVAADEMEGGARMVLNFGHTLGHAIEALSEYDLSHGEAVAAGMVLEAELGERIGVTKPGTALRLAKALEAIEISPRIPASCGWGDLEVFLSRDKKVREGGVRFVLLSEIGKVDQTHGWSRPVSPEDVEAVLAETLLRT